MTALLLMLAAYLIGSIPFGLLMGLAHGVDIRQHGSRNIGATNAGRVLGRKWGLFCLFLDIAKGLAPTAVSGSILVDGEPHALMLLAWLGVGIAAVIGHVFPVYLGFRGGKGVATTIGLALGIYPYFTAAIIVALLGYAAARFATGMVSLGSLALAFIFPFALYGALLWAGKPLADYWPLQIAAVLLGLLIIVRHRDNIGRLLRREEMRSDSTDATAAESRS